VTQQERTAKLCEMFGDVLGIPGVEPEDSFFDLGGHSLLASRLARRIQDEFGVKIPVRRIYQAPTSLALAERLNEA
jgi:nonribosomal peptide synthetase DhbF